MPRRVKPKKRPVESDPDFTFVDHARKDTFADALKRPVSVIAIALSVFIAAGVFYLQRGFISTDLPALEVSYEFVPNQGLTKGVPVAIKVGRLTVFMVSDPMDGEGGARRAKELVERLGEQLARIRDERGKKVHVETESGKLPSLILANSNDEERELLIQLTEEDLKLSNEVEAKKLARNWAERLTDAIKVLAFAEPPKFSTGSEFGAALTAMYNASRLEHGAITEYSLSEAFEKLSPAQREALEVLPQGGDKEQ